jgi:hypothetical protein
MMENRHHIRIDFQPANPLSLKAIDTKVEKKYYKEDNNKHFYLCGIASGLSIDGHGERMDEEAVKGMHEQFKTKDIPLYVNHGKDYTEDIGFLTSSKILDNGDLYHEYRLYDDSDKGRIPDKNIQMAKHVRVISAGLPPYKHPRTFGFSIEGYVPDDRIKFNPATGGKRIMQVDLDPGVSLVTKPAYQSSVANAIVKSLNGTSKKAKAIDLTEYGFKPKREETPQHPAPTQADEVKPLIERVIQRHTKDIFYEQSVLEDALDATLAEILNSNKDQSEKKNELIRSFDYFRDRMLELFEQFGFSKPLNSSFDQLLSPQGSAPSLAQKALVKTNILRKIKMAKTQKMDGQAETLLQDILAKLDMLVQAESAEASDIDALIGAEESEIENEDQVDALEKEDETEDVEKEDDMEEVGKEDEAEELEKEEAETEAVEKALNVLAKKLLAKKAVRKAEEQSEGGDALGTAEERTDEVLPVDPEVVKTLKALRDLMTAKKSTIKAKKKKAAAKKMKSNDAHYKILKGMLGQLINQKKETSEIEKALGKLAEVIGLAPDNTVKTQKGLAMNIGGVDLKKVIKEEINEALGNKAPVQTIRQNPSIVGAIFGGRK